MKKRILGTVVALILSFAMLTGCGGGTSEKDYRNDMEAFAGIDMEDVSDDPQEMIKDMNSVVKGIKVSTPEGKAVKKDLQDFVDLMDKTLNKAADMDEDEAMELYNDLMQLISDLGKDMQTFQDAAVEAGVDEAEFGDIDFDLGLGF